MIQYADGTGAQGDYITDNFAIGGATVKALEMGLAYNVTLDTGLMGIGYDTNEASTDSSTETTPFQYPSIIDTMVSQGLISSKAYSLYLDDLEASTGSIIFGGLDSDKFHGNLLELPIIPTTLSNGTKAYSAFSVDMTGFSLTGQQGNTTSFTTSAFQASAILDSGTTLTYVPDTLANNLYNLLNAYQDGNGNVYVDCNLRTSSPKMTFNFEFGGAKGVNISVAVSEMIFDLTGIFSTGGYTTPGVSFTPCALGIAGSGGSDNILGDTFLRSAYVVYDLKNNLVAIAQTNFNSTTSNIVDFTASATSIPNVSGVASSASGVTNTQTAGPGIGAGSKTATGTGSATGSLIPVKTSASGSTGTASTSSTSSASKSAATGVVPAFDVRGLFVLGISGLFAVLGGGWILA